MRRERFKRECSFDIFSETRINSSPKLVERVGIEENSEEEKINIFQKGGFLGALITPILSILGELLGRMDQVKKMILIDPRMYERLNSANGDIRVKSIMDKMTNAKDKVLSSLDMDMSNILTDPYLTDDKKVQRYTSAQNMCNLMNALASRDESAENAEKRKPSDDLASLPKNLKSKGNRLLDFILNNPDINFNERGKLIVDGSTIADSHASDLVNHVLKKSKIPLIGWNQFKDKLQRMNVPRSLLGVDTVDQKPPSRLVDSEKFKRLSNRRATRVYSISPVSGWSRRDRFESQSRW